MSDMLPTMPELPDTAGPEAERLAKEIVLSALEDFGLHASLGSDDPSVLSAHTQALVEGVVTAAITAMEDPDPFAGAVALTKVATVMGCLAQISASVVLGAEEKGITGLREQLLP